MRTALFPLLLCLLASACGPSPTEQVVVTEGQAGEARFATRPARANQPRPQSGDDYLQGTYWPPAKRGDGSAWISCGYDYAGQGDGRRLRRLDFFSVVDALSHCQSEGVVRLRYRGRIDAGFTATVERVAAMADRMEIGERILDIDSAGGHVEEAIRAGDRIADTRWAIWVRPGAICHSACVLVLAAGDTRSIAGKVGVHRLMRDGSRATSRAELATELKEVNAQVRDYLERNGVAAAVADLMMTIPNRNLRLLSDSELDQFGLDGTNAAQDDLDRIRLMRKCGEAFVRRRDAFAREFDQQCMAPGKAYADKNECGAALQQQFGFPDDACPDEVPMSSYAQRLQAPADDAGLTKDAGTGPDPVSGQAPTRGPARTGAAPSKAE